MIRNKQGVNPKFMGILVIGAIALIIYLSLAGTGSIISVKGFPLDKGTFNWQGVEGTYETVRLGCVDGSVVDQDNTDGIYHICNSFDSSSDLKLSSELTYSSGQQSARTNFIETKIKLPAGKYNVHYSYDVNDYYPGSASVGFNIDGLQKSFKTTGSGKGHTISGVGDYEFTTVITKEVTFRIDTTINSKQESVKGEMTISYIPDKEISSTGIDSTTQEPKILASTKNFFQKVNAWISNLFSKLFGGKK